MLFIMRLDRVEPSEFVPPHGGPKVRSRRTVAVSLPRRFVSIQLYKTTYAGPTWAAGLKAH